MSGQLFISYRREDTAGFAGRLYARLQERLPQQEILMGVDRIEPGLDFVEAIEARVGACALLLALIGTQWLTAADQDGRRRLDNPEDAVRLEVATALRRGIRVIPVLVDGAVMPRSVELPEELKALARRQALPVSPERFLDESEPLLAILQRALETVRSQGRGTPEAPGRVGADRREREGHERPPAPGRANERLGLERRPEEAASLRAEAQTCPEPEGQEAHRHRCEAQDRLAAQRRGRAGKERLELVGRHPALESLVPKAEPSAAAAYPGAEPLAAPRQRGWRWPVVLGGAIAIALLAFSLRFKPGRPAAAAGRGRPPPTPSPLAASNAPGLMPWMSAASPNPTASADEVPPSAVALLQQAAGAGDAESMNQLGELYRQGRGVAQDDGQARDWYQRAAGAGNAAAMNSLGNLYYHGLGMARDYGQARRWYQKAAEAGNERAMNNLGNLYYHGLGVARDYGQARQWYRRAAEAGEAWAMRNLGWLYENGYGVTQDYGQARRWYQKALEAGNPDAEYLLSRLPAK